MCFGRWGGRGKRRGKIRSPNDECLKKGCSSYPRPCLCGSDAESLTLLQPARRFWALNISVLRARLGGGPQEPKDHAVDQQVSGERPRCALFGVLRVF